MKKTTPKILRTKTIAAYNKQCTKIFCLNVRLMFDFIMHIPSITLLMQGQRVVTALFTKIGRMRRIQPNNAVNAVKKYRKQRNKKQTAFISELYSVISTNPQVYTLHVVPLRAVSVCPFKQALLRWFMKIKETIYVHLELEP